MMNISMISQNRKIREPAAMLYLSIKLCDWDHLDELKHYESPSCILVGSTCVQAITYESKIFLIKYSITNLSFPESERRAPTAAVEHGHLRGYF